MFSFIFDLFVSLFPRPRGELSDHLPFGVVVVAVLNWILALLIGGFTLFMHAFLAQGGESIPRPHDASMALAVASPTYLFCCVSLAMNFGLLNLRDWARLLGVALGATFLLAAVMTLAVRILWGDAWLARFMGVMLFGFMGERAPLLVYQCWTLWYLSRASTKEVFLRSSEANELRQ